MSLEQSVMIYDMIGSDEDIAIVTPPDDGGEDPTDPTNPTDPEQPDDPEDVNQTGVWADDTHLPKCDWNVSNKETFCGSDTITVNLNKQFEADFAGSYSVKVLNKNSGKDKTFVYSGEDNEFSLDDKKSVSFTFDYLFNDGENFSVEDKDYSTFSDYSVLVHFSPTDNAENDFYREYTIERSSMVDKSDLTSEWDGKTRTFGKSYVLDVNLKSSSDNSNEITDLIAFKGTTNNWTIQPYGGSSGVVWTYRSVVRDYKDLVQYSTDYYTNYPERRNFQSPTFTLNKGKYVFDISSTYNREQGSSVYPLAVFTAKLIKADGTQLGDSVSYTHKDGVIENFDHLYFGATINERVEGVSVLYSISIPGWNGATSPGVGSYITSTTAPIVSKLDISEVTDYDIQSINSKLEITSTKYTNWYRSSRVTYSSKVRNLSNLIQLLSSYNEPQFSLSPLFDIDKGKYIISSFLTSNDKMTNISGDYELKISIVDLAGNILFSKSLTKNGPDSVVFKRSDFVFETRENYSKVRLIYSLSNTSSSRIISYTSPVLSKYSEDTLNKTDVDLINTLIKISSTSTNSSGIGLDIWKNSGFQVVSSYNGLLYPIEPVVRYSDFVSNPSMYFEAITPSFDLHKGSFDVKFSTAYNTTNNATDENKFALIVDVIRPDNSVIASKTIQTTDKELKVAEQTIGFSLADKEENVRIRYRESIPNFVTNDNWTMYPIRATSPTITQTN